MKTNHICKYSKCNLGEGGQPKEYYACDYCDRVKSWRSMACCREHYDLYIQEILDSRTPNAGLPKRTDKTESEVKEIFEKPVAEVKAETEKEISEYLVDGSSIEKAIDDINEDIEKQSKKRTRRGKK